MVARIVDAYPHSPRRCPAMSSRNKKKPPSKRHSAPSSFDGGGDGGQLRSLDDYFESLQQQQSGSHNNNIIPVQLYNIAGHHLSRLEQPAWLPEDYHAQRFDVICWPKGVRERDTERHSGNERFKIIVSMRLARYKQASNRLDKIKLVKEVVDAVRQAGGKFIRFVPMHSQWPSTTGIDEEADTKPPARATVVPSRPTTTSGAVVGRWIDIGNIKAREKASHALRLEAKNSTNTTTNSVVTTPTRKRTATTALSISKTSSRPAKLPSPPPSISGSDGMTSLTVAAMLQQDSSILDHPPLTQLQQEGMPSLSDPSSTLTEPMPPSDIDDNDSDEDDDDDAAAIGEEIATLMDMFEQDRWSV